MRSHASGYASKRNLLGFTTPVVHREDGSGEKAEEVEHDSGDKNTHAALP